MCHMYMYIYNIYIYIVLKSYFVICTHPVYERKRQAFDAADLKFKIQSSKDRHVLVGLRNIKSSCSFFDGRRMNLGPWMIGISLKAKYTFSLTFESSCFQSVYEIQEVLFPHQGHRMLCRFLRVTLLSHEEFVSPDVGVCPLETHGMYSKVDLLLQKLRALLFSVTPSGIQIAALQPELFWTVFLRDFKNCISWQAHCFGN